MLHELRAVLRFPALICHGETSHWWHRGTQFAVEPLWVVAGNHPNGHESPQRYAPNFQNFSALPAGRSTAVRWFRNARPARDWQNVIRGLPNTNVRRLRSSTYYTGRSSATL